MKPEIEYKVNHFEMIGDKEIQCKGRTFFEALGAGYEGIDERAPSKYIVTEFVKNGKIQVLFDAMIMDRFEYTIPPRWDHTSPCNRAEHGVEYNGDVFRHLYPKYSTQTDYCEKGKAFRESLENQKLTDSEIQSLFRQTKEYRQHEGLMSIKGGRLLYKPEEKVVHIYDHSRVYGAPTQDDLEQLAPSILQRVQQYVPDVRVSFDFGKTYVTKNQKTQMLESLITEFENTHVGIEQ